jgi:GT2 family glycosyltransferase
LVVHDGAAWLNQCLDALAMQTHPLDRLVMVDTGSNDESPHIAATHGRIRQVVDDVSVISMSRDSTFGEAVARAVAQQSPDPPSTGPAPSEVPASAEWLWLLHDDSAPDPQALAHLLDAARRTQSVGVAGPKLITWDDPSRLLEVGLAITRTGRRVGDPVTGEPDQGQHDLRSDVLGVSTSGMLIRHDVFNRLGGFDPAFGQFRDDLDLCWRAHLAGHRVVVAPKARIREAAASANGQRSPELPLTAARRRDRRHGREVALARCSPYVAPVLALWIAVTGISSAAVLLVTKRPREAWEALVDLESLMTPWRPIAARRRWRARSQGVRRVRNRDLRGLFASTTTGFRRSLDTIHDSVAFGPDGSGRARKQILAHPGFLAVLAGALLAVATWRSLLGSLIPANGSGIVGGELLPVSSNAAGLWHAWLDGWHGAGLGDALESAPYLPVLSAGAWVLEHLPLIDTSKSSVDVVIAWLLALSIPASTWTAYLAARVVTRAAWPRAWAALAWGSLATLTTAAAAGRVGAVVAHILLPLVAAGFVCAAKRSSRLSATFGAAVALGVTGTFNPTLGALGALAALVLLVVGRGRTRLRAAVLLLVPIGLLGPWVLRLVDNPLLVLTGPGLTVWQGATAAPWQLGLLHPGGPGSYPALLSAPIVLAGVFAMSRPDVDPPAMTVLAAVTVAGLALGVAAPHVVIGLAPPGAAGAGAPITAWAGTGLDLAALSLIAAALLGLRRLSAEPRGGFPYPGFGRRQILVASVVTAAVLGVGASLAMAGRLGAGGSLTGKASNTPPVVADQAGGPLGSRLLVMTKNADTFGYRLVGSEPGLPVRDLPGTGVAPDPLLAAAVKSIVRESDATSVRAAHDVLANLGVGFVAFRGATTEPLVAQLDATAGMARLSDSHGLTLWRVPPRESSVSPSRLRLVDAKGDSVAPIAVTGDHGRTDVIIGSARAGALATGRRLVVAEPPRWAEHARVAFAGRELSAVSGAEQPTYLLPSDEGQLSITLLPTQPWWRWGQLALLLVVLFLAAPFGSKRSGRTS